MSLNKPIKGIIGACLTPFDDNDRVNFAALEKEINFLVVDCDAVSIAAVEAAEYTMLSRDERKELLKIGTQMVAKRVPVLLGCSSPSPREVIELAEYAATVGGDLIQVLMPLRSGSELRWSPSGFRCCSAVRAHRRAKLLNLRNMPPPLAET